MPAILATMVLFAIPVLLMVPTFALAPVVSKEWIVPKTLMNVKKVSLTLKYKSNLVMCR